jgi:hypothetical protein
MILFLCGVAAGIVLTLVVLIALYICGEDPPLDDPCSGARSPLYGLAAEQKKPENSPKEVRKSWWFWMFIRHRAKG